MSIYRFPLPGENEEPIQPDDVYSRNRLTQDISNTSDVSPIEGVELTPPQTAFSTESLIPSVELEGKPELPEDTMSKYSRIANILGKKSNESVKPTPQVPTVPVQPSPSFDEKDQELEDALKSQRIGNIFGALSTGSSSIYNRLTGDNVDTSAIAKNFEKIAGSPVEGLKLKREEIDKRIKREKEKMDLDSLKEEKDPNSLISKIYRESLREFGYTIPETASASALKSVYDKVLQKKLLKEQIDARLQAAKDAAAERKIRREELGQQRKEEEKRKSDQYQQSFQGKAQKQFEDATKKQRERLNEIEATGDILEDAYKHGGQSSSILGASLAKMIEGPGKLTDKDIKVYITNPALQATILSKGKLAFDGKITKETYDNIKRMMEFSKQRVQKDIDKIADKHATNLVNIPSAGFTYDRARQLIDYNYIPGQSKFQDNENSIKVQMPDGQIGTIPKDKAKDVIKIGGKIL